jgi:hypothetical protein
MSRPVKLRKRYKPIGFGDRYDPESVEGHLNAVAEAREERRFRRLAEQRQAEREAMKPLRVVAYEKLLAWLRSVFPRLR